jgi:protein phosphatase
MVAIFAVEDGIHIAHVGDSRVYRIRNHQMEQLTEDHSLLNDYRKMKRLTEEEIANFPHKNVIVRALGMKESVKVDTRFELPQEGDVVLLCTDGLAGPCSDQEIFEIIDSTPDLSVATQSLIHAANERGGPDNVTCVLARWII